MNIDLILASLFIVSVTYTIVSFVIRFDRKISEREDARRRNQAHRVR